MSAVRLPQLESETGVEEMIRKLFPLLILLLFATATASATTLHGTLTDVDSGAAIDGVTAQLTVVDVYDETILDTTTAWSGKFELEAPNDTVCYIRIIGDDSQRETCYFKSFRVNVIKNQISYYPPPADEIFLKFRVANCDSDSPSRIERDPDHPGPDGDDGDGDDGDGDGDDGDGDDGDGDDGDAGGEVYGGPRTPGGMVPTSTAGRVGGALICVVAVLAIAAVLVLTGVITLGATVVVSGVTLTAIGVIKLAAVIAAVIGFFVLPIITKWGMPLISWLTGLFQDIGNSIFGVFGLHFDETKEMSPGEAIRDVIHTVTETIIREIIKTITEATGLSEQMIWVILIFGGMIAVFMAFSMFRQR
jgi:uncharacterized membrane protein YvlD (DUF360 family)